MQTIFFWVDTCRLLVAFNSSLGVIGRDSCHEVLSEPEPTRDEWQHRSSDLITLVFLLLLVVVVRVFSIEISVRFVTIDELPYPCRFKFNSQKKNIIGVLPFSAPRAGRRVQCPPPARPLSPSTCSCSRLVSRDVEE